MDLRKRRLELDLTLKEVADFVGVNEGTVSRWETVNIKNMRIDKLYRLSTILKVDILQIAGGYKEAKTEVSIKIDTSGIEHYKKLCEKVNEKTAELIPLLEELSTADITVSYEIIRD